MRRTAVGRQRKKSWMLKMVRKRSKRMMAGKLSLID
jgi:hypothetical protein